MKCHLYLITKSAAVVTAFWLLLPLNSWAQTTNGPAKTSPEAPWAVGFGMEGKVTNVRMVQDIIHFQLAGWFWLHQYPGEGTNSQIIKVNCERGISAALTPSSFVAMPSNWVAGSVVNDKAKLFKILNIASERRTVVKFELIEPIINFHTNSITLLDATVARITDAEER